MTDDLDLRALLPAYLLRRRADCAAIDARRRRGDFAWISDLGHRLTGSGTTFGLPAISALGRALTAAATAADGRAVDAIQGRLVALLDQLEKDDEAP